jgi:hypothetical protein
MLPESIGLMSLRELAWPMTQLLQDGVRLNLMSLEALAAAEDQRAELCLAAADENPQLLDAARGTRHARTAHWQLTILFPLLPGGQSGIGRLRGTGSSSSCVAAVSIGGVKAVRGRGAPSAVPRAR